MTNTNTAVPHVKETTREYLDDIAEKYMSCHSGTPASLDDFMAVYDEGMTPEFRALGYAILTMYSEYGGPAE